MFRLLFSNRGEVGAEVKAPAAQAKSEQAPEPKFTQQDLDRIVQERLARDRQKFADYEDLRKKADEYEKQQQAMTQQEMEKKQEYDKLRKSWEERENQYKTQLEQTRQEIQHERVSNTLSSEIFKKNAYPDAVDLLKPLTKYNPDGSITIKGKDANGIDTELPIEQGVEQFLKNRPYLIKTTNQSGAGSSGNQSVTTPAQDSNFASQLQHAMAVGDRKLVQELKTKIRMRDAAKGRVNLL